ncbi:MAG: TIGR03618 family F420-dependent PPOX class oxidoreductase [Pseudonocardia sp.]|nr:TIGR03618 family F420-dependent PPOX class oxidoreductase [Pseudonocardia sp.]
MASLSDLMALAADEHYLVVVSTTRADGTVQSSVVNAGQLEHPLGGGPALAFVTYGRVKLANLRARPWLTVTARSGWRWMSAEGTARIIGPDDPADGVDAERLRLLLREIFTAAGGQHDDWDAYDAEMRRQRRAAVLLTPQRIYSNAGG